MHFNLNHSSEMMKDCNFQNSMNENEKNFQYLEHLEIEFLDPNVQLNKATLSVEENNAEKSNSYKEEGAKENTSSEGLILKELPEHLKYAFLQPEKGKQVIIANGLTELKEHKLLEPLKKYKEAIAWSIEDLKGTSPSIWMHKILME